MPDKSEKERRKQILNDLNAKANEAFENSLPMSRENFTLLFDYLDVQLGEKDCDDSNTLTQTFLQHKGINNSAEVLHWLSENGGYCDCEILANVEEKFL